MSAWRSVIHLRDDHASRSVLPIDSDRTRSAGLKQDFVIIIIINILMRRGMGYIIKKDFKKRAKGFISTCYLMPKVQKKII
jgi:hypothetical protein